MKFSFYSIAGEGKGRLLKLCDEEKTRSANDHRSYSYLRDCILLRSLVLSFWFRRDFFEEIVPVHVWGTSRTQFSAKVNQFRRSMKRESWESRHVLWKIRRLLRIHCSSKVFLYTVFGTAFSTFEGVVLGSEYTNVLLRRKIIAFIMMMTQKMYEYTFNVHIYIYIISHACMDNILSLIDLFEMRYKSSYRDRGHNMAQRGAMVNGLHQRLASLLPLPGLLGVLVCSSLQGRW